MLILEGITWCLLLVSAVSLSTLCRVSSMASESSPNMADVQANDGVISVGTSDVAYCLSAFLSYVHLVQIAGLAPYGLLTRDLCLPVQPPLRATPRPRIRPLPLPPQPRHLRAARLRPLPSRRTAWTWGARPSTPVATAATPPRAPSTRRAAAPRPPPPCSRRPRSSMCCTRTLVLPLPLPRLWPLA